MIVSSDECMTPLRSLHRSSAVVEMLGPLVSGNPTSDVAQLEYDSSDSQLNPPSEDRVEL